MIAGLEHQLMAILEAHLGDYPRSLVCTEDGLPIASYGESTVGTDDLAAFASLFDNVVTRAKRDLGFRDVDEVTLLDKDGHRLIIRPLPIASDARTFLVLWADRRATWRRNTGAASQQIAEVLTPLLQEDV